jgi:hypothetical protein
MENSFRMSLFMPPISPIKDKATGRIVKNATLTPLRTVELSEVYKLVTANTKLAALTLGMSILVAQYWGAGNTNAVERVLAFIMLYAGGLSLVFFALTLLIPETLMSIMTNDATLIAIGSQYLRVSSVSYLFIGLSQMYLCLMKNVGAAVTGMTVSTVGVIVHVERGADLWLVRFTRIGYFRRGDFHGDFPSHRTGVVCACSQPQWPPTFAVVDDVASGCGVAEGFLEV